MQKPERGEGRMELKQIHNTCDSQKVKGLKFKEEEAKTKLT